jgi:ficolin
VYTVDPDGFGTFQVWCDMQNGGGWTVFQRRRDGSADFNRDWSDYKVGFGNLSHEFWLGLDKIHRLTTSNQSVLRIDMMDFKGKTGNAKYQSFSVASESDNYKLNVGGFSGNFITLCLWQIN